MIDGALDDDRRGRSLKRHQSRRRRELRRNKPPPPPAPKRPGSLARRAAGYEGTKDRPSVAWEGLSTLSPITSVHSTQSELRSNIAAQSDLHKPLFGDFVSANRLASPNSSETGKKDKGKGKAKEGSENIGGQRTPLAELSATPRGSVTATVPTIGGPVQLPYPLKTRTPQASEHMQEPLSQSNSPQQTMATETERLPPRTAAGSNSSPPVPPQLPLSPLPEAESKEPATIRQTARPPKASNTFVPAFSSRNAERRKPKHAQDEDDIPIWTTPEPASQAELRRMEKAAYRLLQAQQRKRDREAALKREEGRLNTIEKELIRNALGRDQTSSNSRDCAPGETAKARSKPVNDGMRGDLSTTENRKHFEMDERRKSKLPKAPRSIESKSASRSQSTDQTTIHKPRSRTSARRQRQAESGRSPQDAPMHNGRPKRRDSTVKRLLHRIRERNDTPASRPQTRPQRLRRRIDIMESDEVRNAMGLPRQSRKDQKSLVGNIGTIRRSTTDLRPKIPSPTRSRNRIASPASSPISDQSVIEVSRDSKTKPLKSAMRKRSRSRGRRKHDRGKDKGETEM
jgi:hypothetical protein